jgi:L-asparaginase
MPEIYILATGGTIDKVHDPINEILVFNGQSHIKPMLDIFRVGDIAYDVLMLKDSLEMTDKDRADIVESIMKQKCDKIIITHGTSTMPETARFIADKIKNKTIVLTGAMRPFSFFQSDGEFNLGCAISAARILPNGVYITMNGQILDAANVIKNTKTGTFETIHGK